MATPELQEKWALIEGFLLNARASLHGQLGSSSSRVSELLAEFDDYIQHNELELALDSLAEAGQLISPRARFWHSLLQAAEQMELVEKAEEFRLLFVKAGAGGITRD